jgi:hypothetical protein
MATLTPRSASSTQAAPPVTAAGRPLPLWFTLVLAAVLVAATGYGLLAEGAYRVSPGVRDTLPQTLRGQDLLTLLTVPVLVWSAVGARAGSLRAHVVWLALLLYVAYSYLMYVVAPFNDAFLLYVAAISLSSYGLFNGLVRLDMNVAAAAFTGLPRRALGGFLLAVGVLFVALWLSEILPAIGGGVPERLFVYDIPSTVHVLDLAYVLPLLIATGVLLFRGHAAAPVLATLLVIKMATLGLALLFMVGFVYADTGAADVGEAVIWATITVGSAAWLTTILGRTRTPDAPWLRTRVWP